MGRETGFFAIAVGSGDANGVRRIWNEYPGLLAGTGLSLNHYLDDAISNNHPNVLRALVELGADINSRNTVSDDRGRAWCAVSNDAAACLDWLLQKGVQINFDTTEATRCFALECACAIGSLELVKRLVEHGAVTDYKWKEGGRPRGNPLTIAANGGHEEVAEYLRSTGTPEPQLPLQTDGDGDDRLRAHVTTYFGEPEADEIRQVVPAQPVISIVVVQADDQTVLVTRGMSAAPITQHDGSQLYAELMLQVPADWTVSDLSPHDKKVGMGYWQPATTGCLVPAHQRRSRFHRVHDVPQRHASGQPIIEGHDFHRHDCPFRPLADFATYTDGRQHRHSVPHCSAVHGGIRAGKDRPVSRELLNRFDAQGVGQLVNRSLRTQRRHHAR